MNWSVLPNVITILRVILLFPLSYFMLLPDYKIALVLFFIAGFSDAVDGFLAKRFAWTSRFGAILDPLADKALLVLTMAILTFNQQLSLYLFITVAARDLLIVTGAFLYHKYVAHYDMAPSKLSKFNTFVQILLVTTVLLHLGYREFPSFFIDYLVWLTFATTISSGLHYLWVWGRKMKIDANHKI
jgi:cardiolipin synthase (CMP-forming)